jgi:hypothetical protein
VRQASFFATRQDFCGAGCQPAADCQSGLPLGVRDIKMMNRGFSFFVAFFLKYVIL